MRLRRGRNAPPARPEYAGHLSYDWPVAYPRLARSVRKVSHQFEGLSIWMNLRSGRFAFQPRPDDVYLASYARSGTTWLQMILYQLTTDGNMDFTHITEPIPYFERALSIGRDVNRLPSPRVFKTHLRYHRLPRGPYKRIYIARNGKDVLVSCYHFFRAHSAFKGTFEEFFPQFIAGRIPSGSWFRHVAEWSEHAADPNVLFLRYEDLANDFERTLARIAAFIDRPVPKEQYARIAERCSFQFMKTHEDKFGFLQEVMLEHGFTGEGFIRQGKTGSGKETLSPAQEAIFEQAASVVIMPSPIEPPSQAARA
jgi:Sulfotransferase domain